MFILNSCDHKTKKHFKLADLFLDNRKYYTAFAFLGLLAIVYFVAIILHFQGLLLTLLCAFATINAYLLLRFRNFNEIIEKLSMQNQVLINAISGVSCFCIILQNNNSVLYCDHGFHQIFTNDVKKSHLLEMDFLLQTDLFSLDQKSRIIGWLKKPDKEPFIVSAHTATFGDMQILLKSIEITKSNGKTENLIIICGFQQEVINNFSLKQLIIDRKKLGYYSFNQEKNILDCNEIFVQMLGYNNKSELIGMNLAKLINLDPAHNISHKKIFYAKNHSPLLAYEIDISTDNLVFKRMVAVPLVEDLMQEIDSYLDYGIRNCPIASLTINQEALVEKSNQAFQEMLNIPAKAENLSLLEITHDDCKTDLAKLIQIVAKDSSFELEGSFKKAEIKLTNNLNSDIAVTIYLSRLHAIHNMPVKIICYIIDASDRKTLEMHFVHSQKMQAVGQLAGGIAHDFNNLLTAMMGFCDLLLMRHPPGDQSFADIMQIKQNTNRAAGLVRQLLAFSRKQVLQPEIIDITCVLDELSNLIRRLIGENIELNMNHGRELWLLKVDQGQFEQVIINLAVNARDAMENGGILTIQTSNVVINLPSSIDLDLISPVIDEKIEPGEYVKIDIADTGTGIPQNVISKIFEPFFTTKEVGAGTGLGLSTVYGIVKQTGGYIYLATEIGKGTKFSIFLKRYKQLAHQTDTKIHNVEKPDIIGMTDLTGTGTVLIVEDETPVRIFAVHALTNKGYKVYEAEDGDQALQIVEQYGSEINIIVSDVIMPGMNGPVMIEEISAKYPDIKVIFISGYAEDAFIKQYGLDNKFNFLAKPFSLKQLAAKVKEVMSSTRIKI